MNYAKKHSTPIPLHYMMQTVMTICDVQVPTGKPAENCAVSYHKFQYAEIMPRNNSRMKYVLLNDMELFGNHQISMSIFPTVDALFYYVRQRLMEMCNMSMHTEIWTYGNLWTDVLKAWPVIKFNVHKIDC